MNSAEDVQRQIFDLGQKVSSATEGLVVDQDWDNGQVTVNVGGTEQTMRWAGPAPWPGDSVRVISAGLNPWCLLVEGAPNGTVIDTGASTAVVEGDDSRVYTYIDQFGVSVGQRVRLDHAGRRVGGVYPAEPADSEFVAPAPPPLAGGGSSWFAPIWSGNWNPSFQGPAVEISSSRMGMYGYGTQIADTIPDSSTLTVCELHLVKNWDNVPGVASSMGTHSFTGMPGSASNANLSGTYSVAGSTLVVNLLGVVGDQLKAGTALGVGFRSGASGWRQFAAGPGSGRIFAAWV